MQLMKTQQVGPNQRTKEKTFMEEDRSENIKGECLTDQEWDSGTETILQGSSDRKRLHTLPRILGRTDIWHSSRCSTRFGNVLLKRTFTPFALARLCEVEARLGTCRESNLLGLGDS